MTSKLTREQLEEWVAQFDEDGGCDATDMQLEALIRQSLAAMDSEPVEMPLDYLQGHKDGLEWAAQLAEANHPETGDWLYDDPIELAKAIRKGPDMPPVQPVADSEPDRNPVLAYADSYRDMAKQGVESVPIWSVITDLERNIAPLYRHAQPAPVVPDEYVAPAMTPTNLAYEAGWNACRAAMLHAGNSPAQSDCCPAQNHVFPAQNVVSPAQSPIDHGYQPECECSGCKATARICTEMAVNSLVIPNEMTSEQAYEIGYYYGDPVDVFARGANWMRQHIIDSTLAAAPQLPGSDPATVPGKWIPVSERIPDNTEPVLCIEKRADFGTYGQPFVCWHDGGGWVGKTNYRLIVTHWMPLPAAPQEVKSE